MFKLKFTKEAKEQYKKLEEPNYAKRIKAVRKTLAYLETNPRHPGLNTHEHTEYSRKYGKKVYESYVQNRTPGAYRVFWHYGPEKDVITILAIIPHP
jgi:mRNA-degrading endonuclease RelE of RelBE toxin-antitoxin system